MNRWRIAHGLLASAVLCLIGVLECSHSVLPRLVSPCGRLVHVPAGDHSLGTNHIQLEVPAGASWSEVDVEYRVEPREALSFVLDRNGGDYAVVRVSRLEALASGVETLHENVVRSRQPFDAAANDALPARGTLRFARAGEVLQVTLPGDRVIPIQGPVAPGSFEIVPFPPSNFDLHERARVGTVRLTDGTTLEPRRLRDLATAPVTVAIAVAAAIGLGFTRRGWRERMRRALPSLVPWQSEHRPAAVAVWLGCVIAALVGLAFIPRAELLQSYSGDERGVFRVLVLIVTGWSAVFMRWRDRLLARSERVRQSRFFTAPVLPLQWLVGTVFVVVVLVLLFDLIQVRVEPRKELARAEEGAVLRVPVLGGSTTRGFPFPKNWGGTYPRVLESELRQAVDPRAAVWNLGVDSAGLDSVRKRLERAIDELHPSHVVVNSIVNNGRFTAPEFRDAIAAFVAAEAPKVPHLLFVKEPALEPIYQAHRWMTIAHLYPALDEGARGANVEVVDPLPAFLAHRDEFLFMDDVHLAPRGHQLLAQVLAEAIERNR